jgi:hypothetical protein
MHSNANAATGNAHSAAWTYSNAGWRNTDATAIINTDTNPGHLHGELRRRDRASVASRLGRVESDCRRRGDVCNHDDQCR